ncbi:hypothetical protein QP116_01230 [Pseudoglutamicibacter cumminsii]|uniref:Pyrroline-5-carboxylate reductase catalytic N-terminal domain-containing protein n=1 Tax=Pseudoglutamicibacter cumminsii TaxID=156979 RepID=A0AAP4FHI0_9MICC|nr:hypothetical protein [Pseudoglutamicibacter cumminsii]MDK6274380.1 hypothetical protein [Pseudoglutamicibacter cumminsii]
MGLVVCAGGFVTTVALLGSGFAAQELAPLCAWALATTGAGAGAGRGRLVVWSRNSETLGWVIDDARDAVANDAADSVAAEDVVVADDVVVAAPDAASAVAGFIHGGAEIPPADVVILALPFGSAINDVVAGLGDALAGRAVVDISNPVEMTALGPKQSMYVPAGSAGQELAQRLPAGCVHVHGLTHLDASVWAEAAALGADGSAPAALPLVASAPASDPRVQTVLDLFARMGFDPRVIGGIEDSSLVEVSGPWALAYARRSPISSDFSWKAAAEASLPGA